MTTQSVTALVPIEQTTTFAIEAATTTAVELNPAIAYLVSLDSKRSRRTMTSCLNRVAAMLGYDSLHVCPWGNLRRHHIQAIRERLVELDRAPSTINTYIAALKGVALEAWGMKMLDTDSYQHIKQVRSVRGSRLPRGRALADAEAQGLVVTCEEDKRSIGLRDAAIVSVLLGCGLRRSEVVSLDMEHVDWSQDALRVIGKGNKERLAFMPDGTVKRLRRWVTEVRGDDPGPLFTRIRRHDDVTSSRLTDQAIYYILQKRHQEAQVAKVAPHDLRRTFATNLLDQDVDLLTVKEAMGHASLATTQQYDMRGHKKLKEASKQLSI